MSSGILIYIPNLERNMIPFIPFDNENLDRDLENLKKTAEGNLRTHKTSIHDNPNYHIIAAVANEFTRYLKEEHGTDEYHTKALCCAARLHTIIRDSKKIGFRSYIDSLIRLQRALRKHRIQVMEPGVDQIVARFVYLIKFEDPVMIWDYYALWHEDFGQQKIGVVEEN